MSERKLIRMATAELNAENEKEQIAEILVRRTNGERIVDIARTLGVMERHVSRVVHKKMRCGTALS
jgi:predicted DNA-binding transcriptional regulator